MHMDESPPLGWGLVVQNDVGLWQEANEARLDAQFPR